MKTVGLITEYNPFHKGHAYHINMAKTSCNADYAIVIMSGNYVQRGEPAFADKYTRTEIALNHGADLVIELPVIYAAASAEWFAKGSVSILDALGCVDFLCFGSECKNIDDLMMIARIFTDEPKDFKDILKENLKKGLSFPSARAVALSEYLKDNEQFHKKNLADYLNQPNNILGIEYLKALLTLKSTIQPHSILRIEADYHSNQSKDCFFSATALRKLSDYNLYRKALSEIDKTYLNHFEMCYPICSNDFSLLLGQQLLMYKNKNLSETIFDIGRDFANAIQNQTTDYKDWQSFAMKLKNKNLTYSAISRGLLHILLNIHTDLMTEVKQQPKPAYIRILGFNSNGKKILHKIKEESDIKILTKVSRYQELLKEDSLSLKIFEKNLYADSLYRMVAMNKFHSNFPDEFTQKIIVKK